ncbi:MAG: ferredoxin family protein [Dehalococcoidia bacterium]
MNKSVLEIARGIGFHPLTLLHAFLYGRFTARYLWARNKLTPHLSQVLKDHLVEAYHGKVLRLDDAAQILSHGEDIESLNLEKVLPFKHARDLVLKNPHHIVAYQCACRSVQKNPCQPLDVCLIVGDPFAGAALRMQPGKSRAIGVEEAVTILREEQERGHIHTAYFKDIMLDRFYAICNCCRCCCLQMKDFKENNMRTIVPSGYVAVVSDACDGCGECHGMCQFGAIEIREKALIARAVCFGCGLCESRCPMGAITLERDPDKGEPLDIRALQSGSSS